MRLPQFICLLLFFCTIYCFGQAEIASIDEVYKNRVTMPDEAIALVDTPGERFVMVLFKGKVINGYLFNKKNELIGDLVSEDKTRSYKQVLGKTVLKNTDFVVFLTNKNRKKFASAHFAFQEKKIVFNELDLDLEKERIIQTADYNNRFHILTITPRTGVLNIYRFEDAISYTKFPIDLSAHTFLNEKEKKVDLYDMITVRSGAYGLSKAIDLVKIEADDPTTLEVACEPTKLYQHNEHIIISFDAHEAMTQFVEVNLETLKGKVKQVDKALDTWAYKEKNSNSFLCDEILYQIMTTKRAIHLRAQNYWTGEIINEHGANVNEKITFKNSSIAQTGGTFDNFREFEDTATLLRKVRRGKAGIAAQKTGDIYHLTYGGVIERQVNAMPMMMPGFGVPLASVGAVTVFFNPTFFAYQSYTQTKALLVDGLFDANFEHQAGEINENIFDRIETFEEENRISPAGRTVFKMKDSYILGKYDAYSQTYTLRSF